MGLKEQLSEIVGPESVFDDHGSLSAYAGDLSPVPSRQPDLVIKPRSGEQVESLVKWANEKNVPLIPVSSKSPGLRGATIPRMGGVIVDMGEMDNIIRIDYRNRVVMIEPGVTFARLLPELDKEGLRLSMPLLPHPDKSVLAWALEREPTIMPRYHWDIGDPLLCMEVVYGNGELFRTGEAAGPGTLENQWERGGAQKFPLGPHQVDYHRLVQGSQGTMGIASWISMKCELKPTIQKCFFVTADRVDELSDFAYKLIKLDLIDELFIMNNLTLSSILVTDRDSIKEMCKHLPPWILTFASNGGEYLPEEGIAYRIADIQDTAQQLGIEIRNTLPGVRSEKLLEILSQPSQEPYWKLRYKGGCQEIFFINTLDKADKFIDQMYTAADQYKLPVTDLGVYIQPIVQGSSCHVEFDLFYDPNDDHEKMKVQALHKAAVDILMKEGAFFNRPYPIIAEQVFSRYAEYTSALRKVKDVFDPKGIMNPGKLCF